MTVSGLQPAYLSGTELSCVCVVDPRHCQVQAIETSVMWVTEGKGDQDIGLHYFDRLAVGDLGRTVGSPIEYSIMTRLPSTPQSYRGEILKIEWMVKVRVFANDDSEYTFTFPFRLVGTPQLL